MYTISNGSESSGTPAGSGTGPKRRLQVLASGIDSLYASAAGELRDGVREAFHSVRSLGEGEGVVMQLREEEGHFLLRPYGWRGYPFWLSSPRYECFVGAAQPFPPVYVALHSAFIHTVGVEAALDEAAWQVSTLMRGEVRFIPSRIDLYADTQGWRPRERDFQRFVCRGVHRRMFQPPSQLHGSGRRLSGFMFGKGDVVARVYDKTLEMATRGSNWQELVWKGRNVSEPVWRVEFQFRRRALTSFGVRSMEQVLSGRQDLWEYGATWLSLRRRNRDVNVKRWPEAPAWRSLRETQLGSPKSGLIRQRIRTLDERRLVSGFVGYVSSLAALSGGGNISDASDRAVPLAERYLSDRGMSFADLVERKRLTRLATREFGASRGVP